MTSAHILIGETIGTAVLVLMGTGVCAAVTLKHSKARGAGWVAITFGWGFLILLALSALVWWLAMHFRLPTEEVEKNIEATKAEAAEEEKELGAAP